MSTKESSMTRRTLFGMAIAPLALGVAAANHGPKLMGMSKPHDSDGMRWGLVRIPDSSKKGYMEILGEGRDGDEIIEFAVNLKDFYGMRDRSSRRGQARIDAAWRRTYGLRHSTGDRFRLTLADLRRAA